MEQHCIYYRRKNGVKKRQRKRESPRALKGRSGKYRQMLEDVPEVFSATILSHQEEKDSKRNDDTQKHKILQRSQCTSYQ